ncbi:hypothetical protein [uncultured Desulfovibrio sp.]|uniref:hypothetical protein n=1 Tax=uncultured Desulfovibrio sp. TaxID=167968 RepID=UPI00262DC163|nr:hypothetical protein [uncultured Desulfovibrio sp.]
MENFFDVATVEELKEQFDGILPDAEDLTRKREICASNADYNLELLTYLFVARGEFGKAQTCLHQIADEMLRADTGRMIAHVPEYLDWIAQHPAAG